MNLLEWKLKPVLLFPSAQETFPFNAPLSICLAIVRGSASMEEGKSEQIFFPASVAIMKDVAN